MLRAQLLWCVPGTAETVLDAAQGAASDARAALRWRTHRRSCDECDTAWPLTSTPTASHRCARNDASRAGPRAARRQLAVPEGAPRVLAAQRAPHLHQPRV